MSNFMNIHQLGAQFLEAVGQTDMTKLILTFRNFPNAPINADRCAFLWSFVQMTGTGNEWEHGGSTASRLFVSWVWALTVSWWREHSREHGAARNEAESDASAKLVVVYSLNKQQVFLKVTIIVLSLTRHFSKMEIQHWGLNPKFRLMLASSVKADE